MAEQHTDGEGEPMDLFALMRLRESLAQAVADIDAILEPLKFENLMAPTMASQESAATPKGSP